MPDESEQTLRTAWQKGSTQANANYVRRRITIDPITRLEGHGKIDIFLDEGGQVERAYFQVPELRGFEKFVQGRPAEEMPQITSRICGVCPTAHHMAATKALDHLYQVDPPPAAKKIRELIYTTFIIEDHSLHFYFLGGPDFVVGPEAPAAERNVLGVIGKVGVETGKKVIAMRRRLRELIALAGGKAAHPVFGLPGGVAKHFTPEMQKQFQEVAAEAVEFAQFTLQLFEDVVLKNTDYVQLILSDIYTHRTYYMGLVDDDNRVNFYDGWIRVVTPEGKEWKKFRAEQYLENIAEHVEPWSYVKFCYLKPVGWKGFTEGVESGIYSVAPLARLNVSQGMATPLAQEAYEKFFSTLGGKPVHHTLANHWAILSGRQLCGFHQHPLDMFVALFGERGAHHLVGGALFIAAEPAVTDGFPDRRETRNLSHFQCPGQRGDRADSRNGPKAFDSLGQQRVPLEGTDQGIFRFLQSHDGVSTHPQQRSDTLIHLFVA